MIARLSSICQFVQESEIENRLEKKMAITCSFCQTRGTKGYFRYPKGPERAECLRLAGLPKEVKVENLRICFRHYEAKDFYFVDGGDQVRIKRGKNMFRLITIDFTKNISRRFLEN